MKKSVLAAALAGVMLLSGCSGVSQDEYNSLLEEKTKLETENSSLKSDNSKLESESSTLKSENESLQAENSELQDKINEKEPNSKPTENNEISDNLKKDTFIIGATQFETSKSNKWYYVEGNTMGITAVTYVDDYNDIDDDIFVRNAFMDIIDITVEKPRKGVYSFNWAKENGEIVGHAFSMNIMGNTSQNIEWNGDYSHLNDNSTFQTLFKSWSNTNG